ELGDQFQALELSVKESNDVELDTNDVRLSDEECRRSVLGKIIGDRKASIFGLKRVMGIVWQTNMAFEVKEVGENFFQFIFGCKEDKEKVLAGVNWVFENQYLVLQDWREGLIASDPGFGEISLWVQVHKLPLNWLSIEVGRKIGKLFKKIKNVIVVKSGGVHGSYLRLLVSHDIAEPILRCTHIKLGEQRLGVTFQYEKLVSCCFYCGLVGHLERACTARANDIEEGIQKMGQFGEWLKATETGKTGGSSQNSTPSQTNSNLLQSGNPSNTAHEEEFVAEKSYEETGAELPLIHLPKDNMSVALVVKSSVPETADIPMRQAEDQDIQIGGGQDWVEDRGSVKAKEGSKGKGIVIERRDEQLCYQEMQKLKSSTWKRKKSESGRLQRAMDTNSEEEIIMLGKRGRSIILQ
ncbi:Unknown protein, partial [Striga hermonthica]